VLLSVSARAGSGNLITEGIIPAPRSGRYDLGGCCQGYIRFLKTVPKDKTITDARKLLVQEKAAIATIQRKQLEGSLVKISDLMQGIELSYQACKSRLLAVPTRITPRLHGPADRLKDFALMTDAICEALDEIANIKFVEKKRNEATDAEAA
jgi:hypothetical protein